MAFVFADTRTFQLRQALNFSSRCTCLRAGSFSHNSNFLLTGTLSQPVVVSSRQNQEKSLFQILSSPILLKLLVLKTKLI